MWGGTEQTPELTDRLGWLDLPARMAGEVASVQEFGERVRAAVDRVVLCGMGGSSLAAEVVSRSVEPRSGFPVLVMLDSTDPEAVRRATPPGPDGSRTLVLIASKSGSTLETLCFYRHFRDRLPPERFVAITDPGSALERMAVDEGFMGVFAGDPEVGGRFSALSVFGLVPAALMGVPLDDWLTPAQAAMELVGEPLGPANAAGWLGTLLGAGARTGRDRVLLATPGAPGFGLWAEQLLAESTGKHGVGLLPVLVDEVPPPERMPGGSVVVVLGGPGVMPYDPACETLAAAGYPVVRLVLSSPMALGGEFYRWEFATAVAGATLGINPFDQPNVAESKRNTARVLAGEMTGETVEGTGEDHLDAFLTGVGVEDYLAVLWYAPPTARQEGRLRGIVRNLGKRVAGVVTGSFGPRYLHSTGQLHKGGPPRGHYLFVTEGGTDDLPVPGAGYSFREVREAQMTGDLRALRARGRPCQVIAGLDRLERAVPG